MQDSLGRRLENFTRVETFGDHQENDTNDVNWLRVVVDPKSALYVTGSELDYIDALTDGGFKVKNPNAATSCSCGESFSA